MAKSISQLDQITNEAIDLSQFLAIDDPAQTFKLSLLQLRDFFTGQLYPVGSTLFRLDNRTPTECGFPGTWSKIAADVALHTAAADGSNVGTSTGSNAPAVPVPQHNHTASSASAGDHTHAATNASSGAHTHTASSASAGDHAHTASSASAGDHAHTASSASSGDHTHPFGVTMAFDGSGGTFRIGWGQDPSRGKFSGINSNIEDGGIGNAGAHTHGVTVNNGGAHTHGVTVTNAGAHTHGVTVNGAVDHTHTITVPNAGSHAHTVTVDNTGTAGVTLDVRGARILGHLWQRTA